MSVLVVVRVIATVCTGLAAGIFLGHRRGVSLAAREIGPSSFVRLQQIIHVHFARMMPPLVLGAVLGSLSWAFLLRESWRTPAFWLAGASALEMISVLVMTRAVNIPINNRLMTWDADAPPPDLQEQWGPWERVHSVRTLLATTAFVLQVVALSAFASG